MEAVETARHIAGMEKAMEIAAAKRAAAEALSFRDDLYM
jgi:hypothetical protein